jgi:hypothetical protein
VASADTHAAGRSAAPGAPRYRPELVLAVLAVLCLALIPIHLTTIYSGLPAHPLFLHVPVILIPVAVIWALVLAVRPAWFARSGLWLGAVAVVAFAGLIVTMGAGSALRNALHLGGGFGPGALVARHAHAADILRLLMVGFVGVLIVTVLAHRIAAGWATGWASFDRALARPPALVSLRVLLAVLAIACGYFVFHTGDLGAKAVWQGRLGNRGGGFVVPGGGSGFPGGGGSGSTGSGGSSFPGGGRLPRSSGGAAQNTGGGGTP